jgi:hypothetical protein
MVEEFVVSNFKGYLKVDNAGVGHWVKSPYNADRFTKRENAERNAEMFGAVVVQLS